MSTGRSQLIQQNNLTDFEKQENRDKAVLFFLYCGIANFSHIRNSIFVDGSGKLLHKRACQRRIRFLLESNYIQRKLYKSIRHRKGNYFYALDERGIGELCNYFSLNPDLARCRFPSTYHIAHESVLSDVFRTVYREVKERRYSIDHIYDDREMKRLSRRKAGIYYPDAHVTILPRTGDALTFHIELDAGGHKGYKYLNRKISSWETPTILLTLNQKRLDQIQGYIAGWNHKAIVGFALAGEFISKGFSGTAFTWHPTGDKMKIRLG